MRPQKVSDRDIINGLMKVFRERGYDGASLSELSQATGLKKASLYHRFPNGKEEMAAAVLSDALEWSEEELFQVLTESSSSPAQRLKNGLDKIRFIYDSGGEVCILRSLSMKSGLELFEAQINQALSKWLEAFKTIGIAFGLSSVDAEGYALESLIEIQGSLVVARALGNLLVFEKAILKIEDRYLALELKSN